MFNVVEKSISACLTKRNIIIKTLVSLQEYKKWGQNKQGRDRLHNIRGHTDILSLIEAYKVISSHHKYTDAQLSYIFH